MYSAFWQWLVWIPSKLLQSIKTQTGVLTRGRQPGTLSQALKWVKEALQWQTKLDFYIYTLRTRAQNLLHDLRLIHVCSAGWVMCQSSAFRGLFRSVCVNIVVMIDRCQSFFTLSPEDPLSPLFPEPPWWKTQHALNVTNFTAGLLKLNKTKTIKTLLLLETF